MVRKTIVCLANSFRPGGSCVAGIEIVNGQLASWVRPVSHRQNQAISDGEKTYADGTSLQMLDVVEIPFDAHQPEHHQTENWLITNGARWKKVGKAAPDDVVGAVLPASTPLWRPAQSTYTGRHDLVSGPVAHAHDWSLALVQPETVNVDVAFNPFSQNNEVWVSFSWANTPHKIKLTDPVEFARFNTGVGDCHELERPILCISLAHVWDEKNTASKLVAGLIR
jgi:Dual OB-containing domain